MLVRQYLYINSTRFSRNNNGTHSSAHHDDDDCLSSSTIRGASAAVCGEGGLSCVPCLCCSFVGVARLRVRDVGSSLVFACHTPQSFDPSIHSFIPVGRGRRARRRGRQCDTNAPMCCQKKKTSGLLSRGRTHDVDHAFRAFSLWLLIVTRRSSLFPVLSQSSVMIRTSAAVLLIIVLQTEY